MELMPFYVRICVSGYDKPLECLLSQEPVDRTSEKTNKRRIEDILEFVSAKEYPQEYQQQIALVVRNYLEKARKIEKFNARLKTEIGPRIKKEKIIIGPKTSEYYILYIMINAKPVHLGDGDA